MWLAVSTLTRKRFTKLEMRRRPSRSHLLGHQPATRDSLPAKALRHDKHDIKGNKRHRRIVGHSRNPTACTPGTGKLAQFMERRSRRPSVSGNLALVHSLLTKRRAVDFCRLHSSLCQMP
jgi:hypothetical protein